MHVYGKEQRSAKSGFVKRPLFMFMDMKAVISVLTGEVWATAQKIILRSDGIGSCIVVLAYDALKKVGGVAHIMLPGSSTRNHSYDNTKYAQEAMQDLLFKMVRLGARRDHLEACIVGGGNVLREKCDTLCPALISSVIDIVQQEQIPLVAKAVGGMVRRLAYMDIEEGNVYYSEGDGEITVLYSWGPENE